MEFGKTDRFFDEGVGLIGVGSFLLFADLELLRDRIIFLYTGQPLYEAVCGPAHNAHLAGVDGGFVHVAERWLSPHFTQRGDW